MKITKLTDDSSWLITTDEFSLVIDPWFTNQQVDGFSWFSLQQRNESYGPFDFSQVKNLILFITHPFSDHCNKETLLTFPKNTKVIAESRAFKKIESWNYFSELIKLTEAPFNIKQLTKVTLFNQTHHAFFFRLKDISLIYAPHGVSTIQNIPSADVLMTTTTTYKLPFFLGGTVNLGLKKANALRVKTGAKWVITTHDQQKESKGLVGLFARPIYERDNAFKSLNAGDSLSLT